jgi:hypothetical protein
MKLKPAVHGAVRQAVISSAVTAAVILPLILAAAPASAETRGYVLSWFATATNTPDFAANCPEEAKDLNRVKFGAAANGKGQNGDTGNRDHALVNGKPAPVLDYPDAVQQDPNIETVVGKYAYGFDLGGPAANKFVDPETHGKVDDQLWRAVGCSNSFQATPPAMPYNEGLGWNAMVDTAPGWTMQITGADLSKDGPVMVALDRTLRHLERDAAGGVRSDVTYALDPSPRSHNLLPGEIRNGVLTIKPGYIFLEGDMPFYAEIDLKDAHMRIHSEPDGKLMGYWGGYTDWHTWVYMYSARPANADPVGWYRALEKLADADPDPVTGQNRSISTTWRVEAVPAYLATQDGKILAVASSEGLGGKVSLPAVAPDAVSNDSSAVQPQAVASGTGH